MNEIKSKIPTQVLSRKTEREHRAQISPSYGPVGQQARMRCKSEEQGLKNQPE